MNNPKPSKLKELHLQQLRALGCVEPESEQPIAVDPSTVFIVQETKPVPLAEREPEYVEIEVQAVKHVTDRAVLVEMEDGDHWIPLSQLAEEHTPEKGQTDLTLMVSKWFADKEGLVS